MKNPKYKLIIKFFAIIFLVISEGFYSVRKRVRKILCYCDIHNYITISWMPAEMRYDICDCVGCSGHRYVRDEKGYKIFAIKKQLTEEKRRVLFEKINKPKVLKDIFTPKEVRPINIWR